MSSSAYRGSDEAARARIADLQEELNYARERAVTMRLDLAGKEQHEPVSRYPIVRAPVSMLCGVGVVLTLLVAQPKLNTPFALWMLLGAMLALVVASIFEAAEKGKRATRRTRPRSKHFEAEHVRLEEVERVCDAIHEEIAQEHALIEALAVAEAGSDDNVEGDLVRRGSDDR